MKRLWAPWRIAYLTRETSKNKSQKKSTAKKKTREACVFCEALKDSPAATNLVLHRGQHAYVIMNKYPYANGHLMVIPVRHVADFTNLTKTEHAELGGLLAQCHRILQKELHCQGFNIGMNLGTAAGAGIAGHLHYHIVPRWANDHNFMPIIADLRTIPEHMLVTYKKLKGKF